MAGKEGIFIILDIGRTMSSNFSNTELTRLDFAKESVHHLIRQKLLFSAKRDNIGIILAGASLNDSDDYPYIDLYQELQCPSIEMIHRLDDISATQGKQRADIISCLNMAIDEFVVKYKKLKWNKKIFLITDGEGSAGCDVGAVKRVAEKLNNLDIKVNVIAVDFFAELDDDDEDDDNDDNDDINMKNNNSNDSDKQEHTKKILNTLSELTPNIKIFTSRMANYIYHQFRKKKINPVAKFRGPLYLTQNLSLDVMIYAKTTTQTLPSLKKYSLVPKFDPDPDTCQIQNERLHYVHDDPNKQPISDDYIAKAYYYGNSLVPISKTDEIRFKNDEPKCLRTIGFTDAYRVPRHYYMSGVDMVIPNPQSENDITALKALISEMIKLNKVIIARYVYRQNSDPKLVVLTPHLSKKGPVLYLNTLPTVEDIRDYQFDSFTPATEEQQTFMSKFIDSLDMEKNDEELLKPKETYNPILQYFYQCLETRALNNDNDNKELPSLDEEIAQYLIPDKTLFENNATVTFLPKMFPITESTQVNKEKKQRVFWKDVISNEMQDGLTQKKIEEKLNAKKKETKKTISAITPIEDFNEMMGNKEQDLTVPAIELMQKMIEKFIRDSFKGSYYIRAIECIKVLRDGCDEENEVELFNNFLCYLKDNFPKEKYMDFWLLFIDNNITLISKEENQLSAFTEKECVEWLDSMRKKEIISNTLSDLDNLLLGID